MPASKKRSLRFVALAVATQTVKKTLKTSEKRKRNENEKKQKTLRVLLKIKQEFFKLEVKKFYFLKHNFFQTFFTSWNESAKWKLIFMSFLKSAKWQLTPLSCLKPAKLLLTPLS